MKTSLYRHNLGDYTLSDLGLDEPVTQLLDVLRDMPTHIWPEKSANQKGKYVLQSMLNTHIKMALTNVGWAAEVPPYRLPAGTTGAEKCDFSREQDSLRILVEVELGNARALEANLAKMESAHLYGECDLSIFVVPSDSLSRSIDSGVIFFSDVVNTLRRNHPATWRQRLLVIAIEEDKDHVVDWSQSAFSLPTQLSNTNGEAVDRLHALNQLRAGVALTDIGPAVLPSQRKALAESSRLMNTRANARSPEQSACEQLSIFG